MFHTIHAYEPRPIRFRRVRAVNGWRLKEYSVTFGVAEFDDGSFADGVSMALTALPQPAVTPARPGVGFVILHRGRGADYVVLAWWDNENELPLRVFVRTNGEAAWRAARDSESICVWDLEVVAFERDAYVQNMLAASGADIDGYLARTANRPMAD